MAVSPLPRRNVSSSEAVFSAGAVDLRRALVPAASACTVQQGLCMRVDEDFEIEGELILFGELKVMDE